MPNVIQNRKNLGQGRGYPQRGENTTQQICFFSALFLFWYGMKMGRGIRLVWSSRGTQCGCADGGMDLGSFWEHVSLKLVLKSFQRVLKEIADFQTSCLQFPKTILEPTWLKHIFEMKQKTILETCLENI